MDKYELINDVEQIISAEGFVESYPKLYEELFAQKELQRGEECTLTDKAAEEYVCYLEQYLVREIRPSDDKYFLICLIVVAAINIAFIFCRKFFLGH